MKTIEDANILFVDDEPQILKSIERRVISQPYTSYFAENVEVALKIIEAHEIAVVITDLKMPGINGVEFLKILSDRHPQIVKIVLSGYFEISTILAAIQSGHVFQYLTKPWKFEEELFPAILNAIHRYMLVSEKDSYLKQMGQMQMEIESVKENMMKEKQRLLSVLIKTKEYIDSSHQVLSNLLKYQSNDKLKKLSDDGANLSIVIQKITNI